MKQLLSLAVGLVSWLVLSAPLPAQVGAPFPRDLEFKDFAQTPAQSLEDFSGRLILVEAFAFW
jgi:hypothetical protein